MNQNGNMESDCCEDTASGNSQMTTISSSSPPSYETVISETRLVNGQTEEVADQEKKSQEEAPREVKAQQILHKSSKELYRAVAAQWGITCKMSDHCRCLDCQSHYLDCEYDRDNEQEKTDGGLAAGTPMYLSEVMHGTACNIL